jgi:hypothetical protein
MSVQIETSPALVVVKRRRRLSIPEIARAGAELGPEIDGAIAASGLEVAGPWMFVSHGLPRDPLSLFDWEICRPVRAPEGRAVDGIDALPAVRVATRTFEGPLSGLFAEGYAPLLSGIAEAGLALSGESREVYHLWEGDPERMARVAIQFVLADGT